MSVHQFCKINIGQLQEPSSMACALHASDVDQCLASSAKACTHLTWHVHIWKITSNIGMQHHKRLTCITCGVYASAGRHLHRPMSGSIRQCLCTLGKQRCTMADNINKGMHASAVPCAHQQGNISVGQRHATSSKVYLFFESDISQR